MSLRVDISSYGASKAVCGALKTTLQAHPDFNPNHFGSAFKRIKSALILKHKQESRARFFNKYLKRPIWFIKNFPYSIRKIIEDEKNKKLHKREREYRLYLILKEKYERGT